MTDHGLILPEEPSVNLEILVLTNTEVTDVTLRCIPRNIPFLKLLDVRGSKVTEPGVMRLKTELPSLQVICDFPEWTSDPSKLPSCFCIDRDFKYQEDIKRPPQEQAGPSDPGQLLVHDRIEIIAVEPGIVRLRRIINRPQQMAPLMEEAPEAAPAEGVIEEEPAQRSPETEDPARNEDAPQQLPPEAAAAENEVHTVEGDRGAEHGVPRSALRFGPSSPKRSNNSS